MDLEGEAVQDGVPGQWVARALIGEQIRVRAGALGRDGELRAREIVAPAVRETHDSRHQGVVDLDLRFDRAAGCRDAPSAAISQPDARCILWVNLERAAKGPLREDREVVREDIAGSSLDSIPWYRP